MTINPFTFSSTTARVVFGPGVSATAGDEVSRLGAHRALVLTTPEQHADGEKLCASTDSAVGTYSKAAMHTPVETTEDALEHYRTSGADCVVSFGGGSTIGLGKAISWRTGAPHLAVPTTYAGSEVTPVLGETEHGRKTTRSDARILPDTVLYDPQLTLGLPVPMSVTSALNAMAHAVEGRYAADGNPISSLQALEGLRAIREALPVIVATPDDLAARTTALYGSWLCGTVLGAVGMALHHKLCHTLGGSFGMPHAPTHAVLLPHTAAYNASAAAEQLAPVAELFSGSVGGGLYDFSRSVDAPRSLRELGLAESDLDRAADLAVERPYPNPRPVERDGIRSLLQRAWEGARPE